MNRRRRAYILPVTLVLLALAATVLARVCREGMAESIRVTRSARDLQHRWGVYSAQQTLLPAAPGLLARAEKTKRAPVPWIEADVNLGGERLHVVLADEQAKVSLNTLYRLYGRAGVDGAARLAGRAARPAPAVRLRPLPRLPAFGSLGQIFSEDPPDPQGLLAASRTLTCWGDGRLNWRRASVEAVDTICQHDKAAVERVLAQREHPPVAQALTPLNLPRLKNGRLTDELLTDTSACYSLWLVPSDAPGAEARLAVSERHNDGQTRVTCFSW